jgi:hypothetical protein
MLPSERLTSGQLTATWVLISQNGLNRPQAAKLHAQCIKRPFR